MTTPNMEAARTISRTAGADYSGIGVGQFRFVAVNNAEVTDYTNPDNPGRWYGSNAGPPPIPAGNVLVNTTEGGDCLGVMIGKALPGQPVEIGIGGRLLVVAGETITPGALVSSDATGAGVVADSGDIILGTALEGAQAGDLFSMNFDKAGSA